MKIKLLSFLFLFSFIQAKDYDPTGIFLDRVAFQEGVALLYKFSNKEEFLSSTPNPTSPLFVPLERRLYLYTRHNTLISWKELYCTYSNQIGYQLYIKSPNESLPTQIYKIKKNEQAVGTLHILPPSQDREIANPSFIYEPTDIISY